MTHDRYLPDPDLPEDLHPGAGMPGAWQITRGCEVVVSSFCFSWRLKNWNPEKLQEKVKKKTHQEKGAITSLTHSGRMVILSILPVFVRDKEGYHIVFPARSSLSMQVVHGNSLLFAWLQVCDLFQQKPTKYQLTLQNRISAFFPLKIRRMIFQGIDQF